MISVVAAQAVLVKPAWPSGLVAARDNRPAPFRSVEPNQRHQDIMADAFIRIRVYCSFVEQRGSHASRTPHGLPFV